MEKVSVTVRIPAMDNSYDFIIPDSMLVRDALDLIVTILQSEYGVSVRRPELLLMDLEDERVLPSGYSLKQSGIADGSRLLLI